MIARCLTIALVCALACVATASAAPLGSVAVNAAPAPTNETTNVCNLDWFYCPRDPGCVTYTMSAHTVKVHADGVTSVKAENITDGMNLVVEVYGETTIVAVPASASYRIYALNGKNMAAGVLGDVMTLTAPNFFTLEIPFTVTTDAIGGDGFFGFAIDVFQQKSGTDEGFCLQIADIEYTSYLEHRDDPPFIMDCKDLGNGKFIHDPHKLHPKDIPSVPCGVPPSSCDLKYYYCPRDPGCITYTMSATSVTVDIAESSIAAGDHIHFTVNGTTQLRSVPVDGSYRIYDIAGHNVVGGALADAMTILSCVEEGCYFGVTVDFILPAGSFTPEGWMEWGLDVFQKSSGSDEGFCVEVANQAYVTYEQTHTQPPPGFVTYCKDEGWGHFVHEEKPPREIIWDAMCHLDDAE